MSAHRLVVFELDRFRVGLDVDRVLEILADRPIVSVPGSPPAVRGLVNLRGQLASVIDLRAVLGLPTRGEPGAVHVAIRSGVNTVVLEADGEQGLVDVAPERALDTPGHVPAALAAAVICVHPLEDGLLLELDLDYVLSAATRMDATVARGGHNEGNRFGEKGGVA